TFRRDIRYSWAYMLQRPRSSDPSIVNCAIVVYNKRPLGLSFNVAPNSPAMLGEAAYTAAFNLTTNSITLDWTTSSYPPSVRPGDWLLDCTLVPSVGISLVGGIPTKTNYASAHAYFYRITAVTP